MHTVEAAPPALTMDGVKAAFVCFENSYNADQAEKCGAMYTDPCHVTVNGGAEAGGFGPFTTPTEVGGFLRSLRNELGGTNIKFEVTSVQGTNHKVATLAHCQCHELSVSGLVGCRQWVGDV